MSRKRHKVDIETTSAREYGDERSYVTIFGKEYVFGVDMEMRRRQVFEILRRPVLRVLQARELGRDGNGPHCPARARRQRQPG